MSAEVGSGANVALLARVFQSASRQSHKAGFFHKLGNGFFDRGHWKSFARDDVRCPRISMMNFHPLGTAEGEAGTLRHCDLHA